MVRRNLDILGALPILHQPCLAPWKAQLTLTLLLSLRAISTYLKKKGSTLWIERYVILWVTCPKKEKGERRTKQQHDTFLKTTKYLVITTESYQRKTIDKASDKKTFANCLLQLWKKKKKKKGVGVSKAQLFSAHLKFWCSLTTKVTPMHGDTEYLLWKRTSRRKFSTAVSSDSSKKNVTRRYATSLWDLSSGIPVDNIMFSRLINKFALRRTIRKARAHNSLNSVHYW